MKPRGRAEPLVLLAAAAALLAASGIHPRDRFTCFLGAQGDPWDTQWDMFVALLGPLCAQLFIGRLHDRQIARLEPGEER
jgi:uncharacterized membrane protein YjdF